LSLLIIGRDRNDSVAQIVYELRSRFVDWAQSFQCIIIIITIIIIISLNLLTRTWITNVTPIAFSLETLTFRPIHCVAQKRNCITGTVSCSVADGLRHSVVFSRTAAVGDEFGRPAGVLREVASSTSLAEGPGGADRRHTRCLHVQMSARDKTAVHRRRAAPVRRLRGPTASSLCVVDIYDCPSYASVKFLTRP